MSAPVEARQRRRRHTAGGARRRHGGARVPRARGARPGGAAALRHGREARGELLGGARACAPPGLEPGQKERAVPQPVRPARPVSSHARKERAPWLGPGGGAPLGGMLSCAEAVLAVEGDGDHGSERQRLLLQRGSDERDPQDAALQQLPIASRSSTPVAHVVVEIFDEVSVAPPVADGTHRRTPSMLSAFSGGVSASLRSVRSLASLSASEFEASLDADDLDAAEDLECPLCGECLWSGDVAPREEGADPAEANADERHEAASPVVAYTFSCCNQVSCAECASKWCLKQRQEREREQARLLLHSDEVRELPAPTCPFCRSAISDEEMVAMGVEDVERAERERREAELEERMQEYVRLKIYRGLGLFLFQATMIGMLVGFTISNSQKH